jgi:hypothetical protein
MLITIELKISREDYIEDQKMPLVCSVKGFVQFLFEYGWKRKFTMLFVNGKIVGWKIKKIQWK